MASPIITILNHMGAMGATSLVYHLAWMLEDLGYSVMAVDLDPKADLSTMFLDDEQLENLWVKDSHRPNTIHGALHRVRQDGQVDTPELTLHH